MRIPRWLVWILELGMLAGLIAAGALLLRYAIGMVKDSLYPLEYTDLVEYHAQENQLPLELVYAVIYTESRFRPDATSNIGAMGLMQITPDAYDWVRYRQGLEPESDKEKLYDPAENIATGTYLLRLLMRELDSTENTLAAYHAGRSRVLGWLENPEYAPDGKTLSTIPYADTSAYVKNVMHTMEIYKKML